ncbi:hypothetical protein [Pseudaestuariivita atlantica]|uniref:Uncharacterized protein n=1 Tax=Pseudaestuariivita atlantica TaxID=1317121 RepID=A0A0L1JSB2_9RHOB|nr:hypothetical protein [Pseudaestuariivita atlantica]KNG94288.1 hypothetical protein ATO11_08765 [Pseudaestuariivita atlantica]
MPLPLIAAMIVNLLVLIPVLLFAARGQRADAVFGPDTPARRILFSMYAAIAGVSAGLLALAALQSMPALAPATIAIMCLQIVYKSLTLPWLGLSHPVAATNLAVTLFHALALGAWAMGIGA